MAETCSAYPISVMNGDHAASSYHHDRCTCHVCDGNLQGQAFRGHDGCACCEDCFVSYCAPKCHLCKIPITEAHGKYLKVGNKTVHTHCYVCYSCKGSLQGKRCQMYEGRLYDIQCFASICAVSRCDACQKFIKGNVQSVKDNNKCYHSTCYQCYMCHKTLQGVQHFTAENKMRICVPCLTG